MNAQKDMIPVSTRTIRLPRLLENDTKGPLVLKMLTENSRPLWSGGEIEVPSAHLSPELAAALRNALRAGQVVRGLEGAEDVLGREEKGQHLADKKQGEQRGARLSRLLILADDGADRFYRRVEFLLRRHGARVLAVRLDADSARLGEMVYGPSRLVKLLMIEHKDAVSAVLLAMAGESKE